MNVEFISLVPYAFPVYKVHTYLCILQYFISYIPRIFITLMYVYQFYSLDTNVRPGMHECSVGMYPRIERVVEKLITVYVFSISSHNLLHVDVD